MIAISGPARYFFLRRMRGAREDVANWPPEIKPLSEPENVVAVAVYMHPGEGGWQAEPKLAEADLNADAGGAFVFTRATTLGIADEARRGNVGFDLLGVRVAQPDEKGPEFATHLLVRPLFGAATKRILAAPIDRLVLSAYVEHGDRAEAQLDLKLSPEELARLPQYLPDPVVERLANRALDDAVLSARARNEIKPEVKAGRVTLYGVAELSSTGDQARDALEQTPGVVEVSDQLLYREQLPDRVAQALASRGLGHIDVLSEHGLIVLSGVVPDNASRHKAKDIALRIPGVRGVVVNDLQVAEPLATAEAQQTEPTSHSTTANTHA